MGAEPASRLRYLSRSPEATFGLGEALGRLAPPGLVVCLEGDLGAGKTCFVRGLARGLGIEGPVTSPSFALMNEYEGRHPLLHFDAWMEGRERALLADGGSDALTGGAVCAIEWGERIEEVLPEPYLRIALAHEAAEQRLLDVRVVGTGAPAAQLEALLGALELPSGLSELPCEEE
jgi:tRNA threonylcarbamoyladenosine biosynthesis protein TsaE